MELMIARLQTKPLAPHIARSDRQIPQNVSALVLKALNSEPTERFNTVREWREQLEEAFIEAGLWPNRVELCALDPEERWGLQAIADCDAQELIPQENHKPKFGDIHQAELDPDGVKERKVLRKAEHSGPVESSADAQSEIDMLPRYHHLLGPPSEECLQLTLQEIGKDEGKLAKANTHEQRVELFAQVQVLQRTPDAGHCLNNADVLLRETGDNSHRAGQYKNSSPKINGFNSNNYSRSGAYDLSHEPRDGDEEDEVDLSFRPSRLWIVAAILVLCAIGVGSFWMLQQLDQHRTTEPTTLTKREICGKVGESWPDRALRVLVLPLAVKAPSSQKAREQDRHRHYMQSLFQTTLERLFEMTYTLRRDFLAVSESKWVVAQPDPKLNQKQATMAGTLCQADLVLSGAWLTAHAEQSSVLQGISIVDPSPSSEPRHWLRLFATYTGTVLSWEQTQAPKKIIKPAALDELVQVNDREFVPQQVKSLLQGLVFFAAAKNLQDNNRLFRKLAEKAIVELGKAGVHLPTPHFASQNIPPQSSVLIQAGPFFMGKPNKAQISYLPDFEMDRYEVSREDYAICVIRGLCRPIERWMDPPWDYPRDRVTTADATQYCRMRGMELPTEAQWVKAARGGIQISNKLNPHPKRRYPWGDDEANCKRSNIRWCYKSEKEGQVIPTLLPYYHQLEGISPYGIHHLIGNASEILRDGSLKGGSCFSRDPFISWKEYMDQRSGLSWVGFRCAKQQP
jgi:formylglycine-generating enzyme required for sulfatase activity